MPKKEFVEWSEFRSFLEKLSDEEFSELIEDEFSGVSVADLDSDRGNAALYLYSIYLTDAVMRGEIVEDEEKMIRSELGLEQVPDGEVDDDKAGGKSLVDVPYLVSDEVSFVPTDKLEYNEEYKELFPCFGRTDYDRLKKDIAERGIVTPLILGKDGKILCGFTRFEIAKELGLAVVPVQYVLGDLSEDKEMELIVKDNVLRRHLSAEDKRKFILMYAGERLHVDGRGKHKKKDLERIKPLPDEIEEVSGGEVSAATAASVLAKERKKIKEGKGDGAGGRKIQVDYVKKISGYVGKILDCVGEMPEEQVPDVLKIINKLPRQVKELLKGS